MSDERRRPHVVTLIDFPGAGGGGAEILAEQITLRLDRDRFRRTYCVLRWETAGVPADRLAKAARRLESAGVELLALERSSRLDLRAWRPLIALLRSGEVDVLHSHKFGPNVWGSLLKILTRVPVFVAHEHSWSYEGQPLRRRLDRHLIARTSDAFVAVSSEDRRRMTAVEGIPPARTELIPNGIDAPPVGSRSAVRTELGIPDDAPVVGALSILRAEKGLDLLLKAVALLRDRLPDVRLLVAGNGPEESRLRDQAADLGMADVVDFLGFRTDLGDLLATFDVAASSSVHEGSPLAVMEYMAAGLPIVATAVGGVPHMIEDERHGLLVPSADPQALADGLHRLLSDHALAARLGEAARDRHSLEFTLDGTVDRIAGLYERLLARRGRLPREAAPAPELDDPAESRRSRLMSRARGA